MAKFVSDTWLSVICISAATIATGYVIIACIVVFVCPKPPNLFDYVPFAILVILASIGILDGIDPHANDRKLTFRFLKKPPP